MVLLPRTSYGSEPQPMDVPVLRKLAVALLTGACLFGAVAAYLPFLLDAPAPADAPSPEPDVDMVLLLSLVHGAVAVSSIGLSFLFRARALSDPVEKSGLWLVRWALLEGAALLGVVVVLFAGLQGAVPANPLVYVNFASLAVFAVLVVLDLAAIGSD